MYIFCCSPQIRVIIASGQLPVIVEKSPRASIDVIIILLLFVFSPNTFPSRWTAPVVRHHTQTPRRPTRPRGKERTAPLDPATEV